MVYVYGCEREKLRFEILISYHLLIYLFFFPGFNLYVYIDFESKKSHHDFMSIILLG